MKKAKQIALIIFPISFKGIIYHIIYYIFYYMYYILYNL